MKQFFARILKSELFWSVALILLTTLLTYGINIPRLGYYYDDWYVLWSGAARGSTSVFGLFSTERPYMGFIYSYLYRIFTDQPLLWHGYALLWRFIGGLAFLWIIRLIWPRQKYLSTLMAVLFVLYPGFLSQPDANTKQNHLFGFATALLSIAFMFQGIRVKSKAWKITCSVISMILTVNYLFIYEYMIGLEGMRLALLGFTVYRDGFRQIRSFVKQIIKTWWPYPLLMGGFVYWRLFIFESSRNSTTAGQLAFNYRSDLINMSLRLLFETIKDFLDTLFFAWFVQPFHMLAAANYADIALAFLMAGVVIGIVLLYSVRFKKYWGAEYPDNETPNMTWSFVWMGAFIVFCAITPVIVSDREFNPLDTYKSYGLHPIAGIVLLIVGLVLMLKPRFRNLALLSLIGLSVSAQMLNADNWANYWDYQRDTWWQLTWRAPDIRDNTMVMAYFSVDFALRQDYETWAPIDLIYRPGPTKYPQIQAEILDQDTATNILRGDVVDKYMRDIWLHRDYSKLLLLSLPSKDSCVHVIDGSMPVYSEYESLQVEQVGAHSLIKRILPEGKTPVPPAAIFGTEPAHTWCYYYQKASLARQQGNWAGVGRLYDEAVAKGLKATDKSELFPFIEGLVNLGRDDEASALFAKEIKDHTNLSYGICQALAKDPTYPPEFKYNYSKLHQILCEP